MNKDSCVIIKSTIRLPSIMTKNIITQLSVKNPDKTNAIQSFYNIQRPIKECHLLCNHWLIVNRLNNIGE